MNLSFRKLHVYYLFNFSVVNTKEKKYGGAVALNVFKRGVKALFDETFADD